MSETTNKLEHNNEPPLVKQETNLTPSKPCQKEQTNNVSDTSCEEVVVKLEAIKQEDTLVESIKRHSPITEEQSITPPPPAPIDKVGTTAIFSETPSSSITPIVEMAVSTSATPLSPSPVAATTSPATITVNTTPPVPSSTQPTTSTSLTVTPGTSSPAPNSNTPKPSDTTTHEPPAANKPTPTTENTSVPAVSTPITTFEEIQKQLKNTLDHVEQRNMVSGFQTLSKATGAVVDHCEQLGLTSDDHPYNAIDREQFWAGLNNCWLYALAQRHEPSSDAERMTDQHLYSLREMVVTWADKLERYGLVDYEMGWWEADILAAIDGILAMNYAAAQAAAQAVVAQAAAALFGDDVNMQ